MSGGGQNTIQEKTIPDFLKPYYTYALQQGQNLNEQGGPQMEQLVAPLNGLQGAGLGSIAGAAGGPTASGAASGYLQNLESGAYLDPSSNPFLQKSFEQGLQGIQNSLDSQFGAAGRNVLASAPVQADQAAVLANQLYNPAYGQTLSAMGQGAALAPSVDQAAYLPGQQLLGAGSTLQQQAQNELTAQQNVYNYSQQLPYNTLSWYSSLLGQNASPFGGASSSSSAVPGSQALGALGGAASGAAIGSTFPPWGTLAGALIGAGIGAFA